MTEEHVADVFPVDDLETLNLIMDGTRLEIVECCSEPISATELAEEMGVPRTRLYHHLNLLTDAGVLKVVERVEKGPMTERRYQVAAKEFRPSKKLLASTDVRQRGQAMIGSLFATTEADFLRSIDRGVIDFEPRPDGPRTMSLGRRLTKLTPEELDDLIGRLEALLDEFDIDDDDDPRRTPMAFVHFVYPSSRAL